VFATKNIQKGTLIFTEYPLLLHTPDILYRTARDEVLKRDYKIKSDKFWALPKAACHCPEMRAICGCPDSDYDLIVHENQYTIDGDAAVYEFASKMNHSCDPNTRWMASNDDNAELPLILHFIANRTIKKGSEITILYELVLGPTSNRRKVLQDSRHFDCICDKCVNNEDIPLSVILENRIGGSGTGDKCKDTEVLNKPTMERVWLEQNLEYWSNAYDRWGQELARSKKDDNTKLLKQGLSKEEICDRRMLSFKQAHSEWLKNHNPFKLSAGFIAGFLTFQGAQVQQELLKDLMKLQSGQRMEDSGVGGTII
jgi:hypothetical protein